MMHEVSSFSTKVDEKEISYRIKEIENGFIITKNWEEKDDKGCINYKSEEIYSKVNPFEEEAQNIYSIMEAAIGNKPVE